MLVAVILLLAGAFILLAVDKGNVAAQHGRAAQLAQAITTEADKVLDHLASHGRLSCNKQGLIHLNADLLRSRYLREIGMLDEDRRLVCSSALGRLPEPIKGGYPVITSSDGHELLVNVPLQMARGTLGATIIQRGRFNVVVSPYVTQEVYSHADEVWLHTRDGLILLTSDAPSGATQDQREQIEAAKGTTVKFNGLGYTLITVSPEVDLTFQTQRSLFTILDQNKVLVSAMLAGSLLISILTVGAVAPYVVRLCGVQNRIRFLCDDAHILLLYQPVFDLTTMKPVGCEVLMRMQEDNALLMPDQVIPAILKAGLGRQLDHAVTRKAISELAARLPAWEGSFKLAVNYFPQSIDRTTLLPMLKEATQAAGRNDIKLCIEVTEHSFSDKLIDEVEAIRTAGFLIAVDDFGTGYSNLQLVTKLSPDLLKIDGSFVYELEETTLRSNLIPQIMSIARAVGAQAVAEGIERTEQAQLLAKRGVQYGQGYALARPMAADALIEFLQTYR